MEIYDYSGEGYQTVMRFGAWRVAYLNYADRFDRITYLERHMLTDEAFILLKGQGTLLVGEDAATVVMEPNKLYNIKQGEWHAIRVSRDAQVLIVENADTSRENSEYKDISL